MIPVTPRTSEHLVEWCNAFHYGTKVPHAKNVRFGIGIYQISQGMSWSIASPVRWQSFCSAAMHFIMCAHAYGIDMKGDFPETLGELPSDFAGWDQLLMCIGKAQQQVFYGMEDVLLSTRASRYSRDVLRMRLHDLVVACFSLAPAGYREQGCFDEMKILLGDLPVRP